MDMFMDMDPAVPSPDLSSQRMSSLVFRPEMRIAPPSSCSLPSLLADSSPQNDPLRNVPLTSYQSNPEVDLPSYTYRTTHSQLSDRLNSCSYTFIDSPNNSNSGYHPENHLSLLRSRSSMSDQTNPHTGSLSTLIAIAATRLDRFEPQESGCGGYPTSTLQASPALIESSISSESLGNPEGLQQTKSQSFSHDEYVKSSKSTLFKSTRTATPCSTSPSEPKDLDHQSRYDSHSRSNENMSFEDFGSNHNSAASVSFYNHPNTAKNWRDENITQFAAEMYQATNNSSEVNTR